MRQLPLSERGAVPTELFFDGGADWTAVCSAGRTYSSCLGAGHHVGVDGRSRDKGPPTDEDLLEIAASAHPPDGRAVDAEKTRGLELRDQEDRTEDLSHNGRREIVLAGGHSNKLMVGHDQRLVALRPDLTAR